MKRPRASAPARAASGSGKPSARKGAPRPGARAPLVVAAIVAVVALAGYGWWRWQSAPAARDSSGTPGASRPAVAGLTLKDMQDSLRAHYDVRDWEHAVRWGHECNVAAPGTAGLLLLEALAWHNYAQDPSQAWPGRAATRTSLDRIELEKRAFALLDSAEAVAKTDEEWANIRRWRGTQYEGLGLPLDAVQAFDASLKRSPGFRPAMERLGWLQRVFIKPADPRSVTAKESAPLP